MHSSRPCLPAAVHTQATAAGGFDALFEDTSSATTNGAGRRHHSLVPRFHSLPRQQFSARLQLQLVFRPPPGTRFTLPPNANISVPIYAYTNVYVNTSAKAKACLSLCPAVQPGSPARQSSPAVQPGILILSIS